MGVLKNNQAISTYAQAMLILKLEIHFKGVGGQVLLERVAFGH